MNKQENRADIAVIAAMSARLLHITLMPLHRHVYASVVVHFQNVHTVPVELLAVQNPVNNLFHNLFTFLF